MQLPLIDITDIGKYLAPALDDPEKYNGRRFIAATSFYTVQDIVDTWSKVSGKKVTLITPADIPHLISDPIKQVMAQPGLFLTKWGYFGPSGHQDLDWTLSQMSVNEKLTKWEEFLTKYSP
jgi:hypothetical protein